MSQKKLQYGLGLSDALRIGMRLDHIAADTRKLRDQFEPSFLLHHLYESVNITDEKWLKKSSKSNLETLTSTITPLVKTINEDIATANTVLKCLDFKGSKIPQISTKELINISRERLNTIFKIESAQKMSHQKFNLAFERLIYGTKKGIEDFLNQVEKEKFSGECVKFSKAYRLGIEQALDVCSIGYYSTAVFIAGRTAEEILNDYFRVLFKLKRCVRFDLKKFTFENKVGKLHNLKEINRELFYKLNTVVIDRNEFGHPSGKILTKKEAHLRINQIIELIKPLDKKLTKLMDSIE